MKISSVRLGFATNSSSSHSIVILPKPGARDQGVDSHFGWEFFTAASKKSKSRYLAGTLYNNLRSQTSAPIAEAIIRDWVGVDVSSDQEECIDIDHQSILELPKDWDNDKIVDKKFFDDFYEFLMRDNVVVLGGNDNTDREHPLTSAGRTFGQQLPTEHYGGLPIVAKKDGEHWILFNRGGGAKIRLTFNDDAPDYTKAFFPELVDVKITDYCNFGCSFCYQNSTEEGKHADYNAISRLAQVFGLNRVFEVALGGGETTSHPDFVRILYSFRRAGVVPNFTTKTLDWLDGPDKDKILDTCGAFAYSISGPDSITKLRAAIDKHKIDRCKVVAQLVMGTVTQEQFEEALRKASEHRVSITLLGFKQIGRGHTYNFLPYDWWLDSIQKVREEDGCYFRLGVDTALAAQYEKEILAADIPRYMFSVEEGKFSAYVDMVEAKVGKSSYHEDSFVELAGLKSGRYGSWSADQFAEIFAKF